jgi:hypothetical protein
MRLIGYDEEYFGNAALDGAYLKSINFLTSAMEYTQKKKISKKIK